MNMFLKKDKDNKMKFSEYMIRETILMLGLLSVPILIDIILGRDKDYVLSIIISGILAVLFPLASWFLSNDKEKSD